MEYRNNKNSNFAHRKKCTINSIKEVEYFLCNLDKFYKYIRLYKILK